MPPGTSDRPRIGILGASGYMGGEALRILLEHDGVEVAWATSRTPGPAHHHHPNLLGTDLELVHPDEASTDCDLVFLALPTQAAIAEARRFVSAGVRVVDLGAAFRLKTRATWERVYGTTHEAWDLVDQATYGVPELHEVAIRNAQVVANPGCFSSAAILGLAPLVAEGLVDNDRVFVDGISGTTGVGAELWRGAHHPEIGNNLVPYDACDHRHTYEMEQELSLLCDAEVKVHFTPIYAPITRGILDVCHGLLARPIRREQALDLFRDFYRDAPFVLVHDAPDEAGASYRFRPYPWVSAVAGTNYAHIGLDVDPRRGRIVVFSVLDSIGKGGALVGIENMNLMLGLPRTAGLARRGMHPN